MANDFTKEELELIGYCFENISQRKFMENKDIHPMYLRIRSMIDNYCEHDNSVSVGLHNLCNKCGHIQ